MRLYHYSNKHIKDKIKPVYFGNNTYTDNDKNISAIKRSFFFTTAKIPEYRFQNSKYKYTAIINDKNIYNLISDNKALIKRGKSIDYILQKIKKLGYKGALYNVGYNVVILFQDINISKTKKKGGGK